MNPKAVREARELVRLALEGATSAPEWGVRARKLLGMREAKADASK